MAKVIVELTGDEQKVLAAYRKAEEADKRLRESTGKTGRAGADSGKVFSEGWIKAGKGAAGGVDQLLKELRKTGPEGQAAAKSVEEHFRATGKAGRQSMGDIITKLNELDPVAGQAAQRVRTELGEAARFSEGRFTSTLDELRKVGPVGKQVADQMRTHLVAAGEISERSVGDVIAKIREIDPAAAEAAQKMHQEIEAANQKGAEGFAGFSESASAQIGKIALSYLGVHKAIETVISLNNDVVKTNEAVFASLKQTESGDRRLLQVANQGPGDFARLRDLADDLAGTYGISREEARELVFAARSEKFEESLDYIAGNQQILKVGSQAAVAGQLPKLFNAEGLTPEQAVEATLAGSLQSRADFETIARVAPIAAEGAKMQGARADETIASIAVMTDEFSSAETSAQRIKALTTKFALDQGVTPKGDERGRESLAGLGLIPAVKALRDLPEEMRREFLGSSQEANVAYAKLSENLEMLEQIQQVVAGAIATAGTSESLTAERRRQIDESPGSRVIREDRAAEIRLEIARERRRAVAQGKRSTEMNRVLGDAEQSDASELRIAAAERAGNWAKTIGLADYAPDVTAQVAMPSSNSPLMLPTGVGMQQSLIQTTVLGMHQFVRGVMDRHASRQPRDDDNTPLKPQRPSDVETEFGQSSSNANRSKRDEDGNTPLKPQRPSDVETEFGQSSTNATRSGRDEDDRETRELMQKQITLLEKIAGASDKTAEAAVATAGATKATAANTAEEPVPVDFSSVWGASLDQQDSR